MPGALRWGAVEPGLAAEWPGLRLAWTACSAVPGPSPPALRERLRYVSDRFRGPQAIALPVWALDAAAVEGEPELRPAAAGGPRRRRARAAGRAARGGRRRGGAGEARELRGTGYSKHRWTVEEDGVLVGAFGHLHPGGLWTDLKLTRDGRTVPLFRSTAEYFEPAGAVSWDVAMTATPEDWRAGVRKGDVLSVSATYDTSRASWYESMGIMPVAFDAGGSGPDPFAVDVDVPGEITHGHLAENRNHGGAFGGLPDARRLLAAPPPPSRTVPVRGFLYGRGDLGLTGRRGRPPTVRPGRRLRFVNRDARRNVFHTITSCRAPCNGATGVAHPLANGPVRFDSGNLGFGPEGLTPAAQRISWKTPRKMRAGTYTYFCRVHPFMRGAFRVAGKRRG